MQWEGRKDVTDFFASLHPEGDIGALPLIATRANGQPAFADYLDSSQSHRPHGIMVLTVSGSKISSICGFDDTALFAAFGLPETPPR
ncbi:MAG: hypothetical protein IIC71_07490 [Acidobacteria bacterium]|nr:hypothetical protein [Acidobacteriota bacterium]